jgi:hypothetical protein
MGRLGAVSVFFVVVILAACGGEDVADQASVGDLDLPARSGNPGYLIAIVHEFDGVTFIPSEGQPVTAALQTTIGTIYGGSFGFPRWVDDDTVEYTARIGSDIVQFVHASMDGSVTVAGPVEESLPWMLSPDGSGLYRGDAGWQVGTAGSLTAVSVGADDLWPLVPSPDGWFLGRLRRELVRIDTSGAVETYPLPDLGLAQGDGGLRPVLPTAAAFGPGDMLALGLEDNRLVIVTDGAVVEVAVLPRPAHVLAWDQTGTALITAVTGEPPDPEAGWLLCDLQGDSVCQRIGPTLWKKDLTIIKAFTE